MAELWTPLPDILGAERDGVIDWRLAPPELDIDQVSVNQSAVMHVARVAGFERLVVCGATDESEPSESQRTDTGAQQDHPRTTARIDIDQSTLHEQIREDSHTPEKLYAQYLDQAVTSGLMQATRAHTLTTGVVEFSRLLQVMPSGPTEVTTISGLAGEYPSISLTLAGLMYGAAVALRDQRRRSKGEARSLNPFDVQPVRFARAAIKVRSSQFVAHRPE